MAPSLFEFFVLTPSVKPSVIPATAFFTGRQNFELRESEHLHVMVTVGMPAVKVERFLRARTIPVWSI